MGSKNKQCRHYFVAEMLRGTSEDWSGRVRQTPDNGFIGACNHVFQ
ncbi:MAG: hypothetical protein R2829_12925 [Bacteroidia bacterium]